MLMRSTSAAGSPGKGCLKKETPGKGSLRKESPGRGRPEDGRQARAGTRGAAAVCARRVTKEDAGLVLREDA